MRAGRQAIPAENWGDSLRQIETAPFTCQKPEQ